MSFASLHFLFGFLPVFFAIYFSGLSLGAKNSTLNGIALFGSLLFYLWGAPTFLPILLASCFVDYRISRAFLRTHLREQQKRLLLTFSIAMNVGALFYLKYANFFVAQLNEALQHFSIAALPWTEVILPIGISFITFEKLSYVIDVYRGTTSPAPSFITYLLFIALFPHLIAGPIFRYHDLADQLCHRQHSLSDIRQGILRFVLGLSKKTLIADSLAIVADRVFALPPSELSFLRSWLGILCYSFQIYFDFSGYSDMAIGLGRMMGFRFSENFNNPYISQSITEFWRRWHISLSSWLREYLYYPLGGNRKGTLRTYFNLWIVFLISGFWHGANWTFLVWGAYHGFFLMLDKLFLLNALEKLPRFARVGITFLFVICGWVFFRSNSLAYAFEFLGHMFAILPSSPTPQMALIYDTSNRSLAMLALAVMLSFLPFFAGKKITPSVIHQVQWGKGFPSLSLNVAALLLLFLSAAALATSSFHPFIYFQF